MALPLRRVSHVSISVSDLERSKDFYRDTFGWEEEFHMELDPGPLTELAGSGGKGGRAAGGRIGDLRVELMELDWMPKTRPSPGLGLRVLSFEVDDIRAAYDQVRDLGIPTQSPPVELHGTRMFFVQDPDGQGIEVVEYVPGGGAGWKDAS